MRALVTGTGTVGLAAATALARIGVKVDVVEAGPETDTDDAGLNQPANALRALRGLGVLEECRRAGFAYDRTLFQDRGGRLLATCPAELGPGVPPYLAVSRANLHAVLTTAAESAGAKITFDTAVRELTDYGETVEVELTDGRYDGYDLVVGCDGVHSPLRRWMFGDRYAATFTGYAVWRVIVPRPPEVTEARFRHGAGGQAGVVPISRDAMYLLHIGPAAVNPAAVNPAAVNTAAGGTGHGLAGVLGHRLERFGMGHAIGEAEGVVYTPLWEVPLPPTWYRGRVVLLGNAAHACVPHTVQSTGMALEDAVVLAEELPTPGFLPRFLWRRYDRVRRVRDAARTMFAHAMRPDEDAGLAVARRLPEVETTLNQAH